MCARQKGIIRLDGTLGGLTFYNAQGEDLVKTVSAVSRDRILNSPNFKRTRENMSEFGGSAKVGKALRKGFANIIKQMSDRYLTGRITGLMKKVNSEGTGSRGERSIAVSLHKEILEGMEFNKHIPFESVFFAPSTLTANANRDIVTWDIPDFNTDSYVIPPEGATHFKLILSVALLSDYSYVNPGAGYEPDSPAENELNALSISSEIPLGGMVGSAISLIADVGVGAALPANISTLAAIGVVFYQDVNGTFYELASDNSMQLVSIF